VTEQIDQERLSEELGLLLRHGLGRHGGSLTEADVQTLSGLATELGGDQSEDWAIRIGRMVIEEIIAIKGAAERLAVADMFGIDIEIEDVSEQAVLETINAIDSVLPLEGPGNRYDRAGQRYVSAVRPQGYKESYVKNTLRANWLRDLAGRLVARRAVRSGVPDGPEETGPASPIHPATDPESSSEINAGAPSYLLLGSMGAVFVIIGLAWIFAAAVAN
jgi:hypothetical protein